MRHAAWRRLDVPGRDACRLDRGRAGARRVRLKVRADRRRRWTLNGAVDLDLSFSPATTVLPIRRLRTTVGAEAHVRAAWLRVPELRLEALDQVNRRTGPTTYHYRTGDGSFRATFRTDAEGFVARYGSLREGLGSRRGAAPNGVRGSGEL